MGKINSRSKGVRGEMEIRDIYQQNLGLTFKRDIEQYRAGDHGDLICVDMDFPFVTEVKLYAAGYGARPDWWDQVYKAASRQTNCRCWSTGLTANNGGGAFR